MKIIQLTASDAMTLVLLLLIAACLVLAWTPATGALAAVGCALILWTVLCHLATTPNSDEMDT